MPPEIFVRIVGGFNYSEVQRLLHVTKSPATARIIAKQTGQTKRPDWLADQAGFELRHSRLRISI